MKIKFLLSIFAVLCLQVVLWEQVQVHVQATPQHKNWNEFSTPIYNPYPLSSLPEDYWPFVIYDVHKFSGDGDTYSYKMWHQGSDTIQGNLALSLSDDGLVWTLKGDTNLSPAAHACVVYDHQVTPPYKIWYWNLQASTSSAGVIKYAESNDGLTWFNDQSVTQNASAPLVTGTGDLYQLYGPGHVLWNSHSTSATTPNDPYSYPFTLFYDIAQQDQSGPGPIEGIGLAYSTDGIFWSRFISSTVTGPILSPPGSSFGDPSLWDAHYAYRPSLIFTQNKWHMYYSGSNIYQPGGLFYAHNLGHASSADGISWNLDTEDIFSYADGVVWRAGRTYTPFVLKVSGLLQMWFTGGANDQPGNNQAIGYATKHLPP